MKPKHCFILPILLIITIILMTACSQQQIKAPEIPVAPSIEETKQPTQPIEKETQPQFQQPQQTVQQAAWQLGGIAIAGKYADAEIVELGSGNYRMYYSIEPEVPGNKLEVFSATSTDGINWKKEEGVRKEFATFPDVVKLPDGRFRMYFQNAGVIKSAISQ
ncbi:hypothetical protein HYW72_00750, partial [Candidatus Nomurabacteria bacterium]|nr:hypothetical protein [Candidatus Nomurabacteria bacterium]